MWDTKNPSTFIGTFVKTKTEKERKEKKKRKKKRAMLWVMTSIFSPYFGLCAK